MALITIDAARHGPNVHLMVNGVPYTLTTGSQISVSTEQLEAIDHANVTYTRNYRTTNSALAALTIDVATIDHTASIGDTVGTLSGATSGSALAMTDDASGKFSLVSGVVKVAGALSAGSPSVVIRETHDEFANSPRSTTIALTVT